MLILCMVSRDAPLTLYRSMCRKVTNLADGVTDDDIKELFESVGPVKFAAIEWDRR